jgi:8-oxo-dGTP pyrophosphatase MutT (NUDIX family)
MTQYVLCYAHLVRDRENMLVIERKKQDWQLGKLNLLGGRIEPGESADHAAVRELKEEANVDVIMRSCLGTMIYPESLIYVIDCSFHPSANEIVSTHEGNVSWFHYPDVLHDPRLIPNLRVIIPLAVAGLSGWKLSGLPGAPDETVKLDLAGCAP